MGDETENINQDSELAVEAKRQTIILAFSLAGTVGTLWIMRYLSSPDSFRTLKMWSYLAIKRSATAQGDRFYELARWAATGYNREKL